MKYKLLKANGIWSVLFPRSDGALHGFGFSTWRDAADYLIEETT